MKKREQKGPVELNMVPVMNLFLAMIPFLLASAAFYHVANINASVPAISDESAAPDEEPKKELEKVSMNLQITKEGFVLSATGDQSPDDLKAIGGKVGMAGTEYDYEKLRERMKAIKVKYPKSETVVILPDKETLYDTVIKTMDATREVVLENNARDYMFTNTVVSSIL